MRQGSAVREVVLDRDVREPEMLSASTAPPGYLVVRRPDNARATRLLAWRPSVTLPEGLATVVIAFESDNQSHTLTAL